MARPSSTTKNSRTSAGRRAGCPRISATTVMTNATAVKNPSAPMTISSRWARALGCTCSAPFPPGPSALDAARGKAGHDPPLEDQDQDDQRDRDDGPGGHDGRVRLLVRQTAGELRDGDGHRQRERDVGDDQRLVAADPVDVREQLE